MTDSYHDMLINRRLIIRAALSMILLCIFCVLLILIFYVELPPSMETMSATLFRIVPYSVNRSPQEDFRPLIVTTGDNYEHISFQS